jgi:hypothetical protein
MTFADMAVMAVVRLSRRAYMPSPRDTPYDQAPEERVDVAPMNRLTSEKRAQVTSCLIEDCSIRSTVRMAEVAIKTDMRVLVEVGEVCADYQSKVFRNLSTRRLRLDEMWESISYREKEHDRRDRQEATGRWRRVALGCRGRGYETGSSVDAWPARYRDSNHVCFRSGLATQQPSTDAKCIGSDVRHVSGNPNPKYSTS